MSVGHTGTYYIELTTPAACREKELDQLAAARVELEWRRDCAGAVARGRAVLDVGDLLWRRLWLFLARPRLPAFAARWFDEGPALVHGDDPRVGASS